MIPVKRGSTASAHNNNLNFNVHNSSPELGLKLGVYGTITVKIHSIRVIKVV